jgi:hypothetical protein
MANEAVWMTGAASKVAGRFDSMAGSRKVSETVHLEAWIDAAADPLGSRGALIKL